MKRLVTFDIDTIVTGKILKHVPQIYDHIDKYMLANGFKHVEGSVYISNEPMSVNTAAHVIAIMYITYPYMTKCVRDMITAEVKPFHSFNHLADYNGEPGKFAIENTIKTKNGPIPKDDFNVEYVLKNGVPTLSYEKNNEIVPDNQKNR